MGHGSITTAPWPKIRSDKTYKQAWPELDESIDPVQSAADYYLLFGMVNNSFIKFDELRLPSQTEVMDAAIKLGFSFHDLMVRAVRIQQIVDNDPRKDLTELSDAAESMMCGLVEKLDPVFKAYVYMACGGELRHHSAIGGNTLSVTRAKAWSAYRNIVDQYGFEQVLTTTALYFRDFNSNSYGSERWAIAAELLLQREKGELGPTDYLNKMLFVDRVFTLEHNGGCFLNKIEWGNKRTNLDAPLCYNVNNMKQIVLDAHCSNPPQIAQLYKCASKDVRDLVRNYFQAAYDHDMNIMIDDYRSFINTDKTDSSTTNSVPSTVPESTVPQSKQLPSWQKLGGNWPNTGNTNLVVYKNGASIDFTEIEKHSVLSTKYTSNSVMVSFEPTVLHNGIDCDLYKSYSLDSIQELSNKNFYWKHLAKTNHKGSTVKKSTMVIHWGNYSIKLDHKHTPSTIYGYSLAAILYSVREHFEENN